MIEMLMFLYGSWRTDGGKSQIPWQKVLMGIQFQDHDLSRIYILSHECGKKDASEVISMETEGC
jgi:hypothetical protein